MPQLHLDFDTHSIAFEIFDTPVARTWLQMVDMTIAGREHAAVARIRGFTDQYAIHAVKKMKYLVGMTNRHLGKFLDQEYLNVMLQEQFDRGDLNYLHGVLETIGKHELDETQSMVLAQVNAAIHDLETFLDADGCPIRRVEKNPFVRVRFHDEYGKLDDLRLSYAFDLVDDTDTFERIQPGRLYLGYPHLGKPPLLAYRDRDTTVEPVPHSEYTTTFKFFLREKEYPQESDDVITQWQIQHFGKTFGPIGDPCVGEIIGDRVWHLVRLGDNPVLKDVRLEW